MKSIASISLVIAIGVVLFIIPSVGPSFNDQKVDLAQFNLAPPCANPDSAALMALFNSTNGLGWSNKTGWGSSCDVCQWHGVICNTDGRVITLNLSSNNLQGFIPAEIGALTALERLNLDFNQLGGLIPVELTQLPLKFLALTYNQYTGALPSSISNLSATIEELHITGNSFSGSIPPAIGTLTNLQFLAVENNLFTAIPPEIGNLDNLRYFYCGGMPITTLPKSIGDLANLIELYLSFNEITQIPDEIGNLASIREIYIEYNQLSGSLPTTIANLITLRAMSLEGNSISGPIPTEFGDLTNLERLYLGDNNLSGNLPPELGDLPNLITFEVWDNALEGCVPNSYASLCPGLSFYFFGNPCLWQGSLTQFCSGTTCSFNDYTLSSAKSSICVGSSIDLITTGGNSFSWSTGESTSSISVTPLVDTWYYLTLTATTGCTRMDSILINMNELPIASASGTDVTSTGGSDGTAIASAINGLLPFSYTWSNGATTQNIGALTAGPYYVTITDFNGCSDSTSLIISEPACAAAGTPCDDGDLATINDVEDGNCNCTGTPGGTGCHPDYDALMAIYNATGGPTWTNMVNWGSTCDVCMWDNVQCDGSGRVNYLVLQYDLVGDIPPQLGNLTELETLRIYNNEVTSIPSTIGNLSKLVYLEVAFEPLLDSLPVQIGLLTNLETIYFNYTAVRTLPTELGNLTNLTYLDLEGAELVGSIPISLANLTKLESLYLSDNMLSGELPCFLGQLPNLTELFLDDNNFTGCIPSSFQSFCGYSPAYFSLRFNPDLQDFATFCTGAQCLEDINLITASTDTVVCVGTPVQLTVPPSAGYLWSTGDISQSIEVTILADTVISVFLELPSGCTKFDLINFTSSIAPSVVENITLVTSPDDSDGAIELEVSEGYPPFTYDWSDGSTSEDLLNIGTGSYDLTITDINGCQHYFNYEVSSQCLAAGTTCDDEDPNTYHDIEDGSCHCTGIPCPVIISGLSKTDITCFGANDGNATVNPTGGTNPYTYSWSSGATTSSISGLWPNSYSVTISDANGCSVIDVINIVEPADLTSSTIATDESVPGARDGAIDLMVAGGAGPYIFAWSNGATAEDIVGLPGSNATYLVTITDAHGCLAFDQATIQTGCAPAGTLCNDGDPDTYTDQHDGSCGCSGTPCTPINASLEVIDISCSGRSDGLLSINIKDGQRNQIEWSTGDTTKIIRDLPSGTYRVTISDENQCSMELSASISEPPILEIALNPRDESIIGARDGSIDLTITGGSAPYQIAWSTGSVEEDIGNLPGAGITYHVTVTDAQGCEVSSSATINTGCAPAGESCDDGNKLTFDDVQDGSCTCVGLPCPSFNLNATIERISCFDANDGSISIEPSGGTAPYQILWNNGKSDSRIDGLNARIYVVNVTDANGCQQTEYFQLSAPSELNLNIATVHESSPGAQDARIDISASGGLSPYQYQWSNGATSAHLDKLAGDSTVLTVQVTDDLGCSASADILLLTECPALGTSCDDHNPETHNDVYDSMCYCQGTPCDSLPLIRLETLDASCYGTSDGSAALDTSGTGRWAIKWSNGSNSLNISDIARGDYTVTLTKPTSCQQIIPFKVNQPAALQVTLSGVDVMEGRPNSGNASVSVAGGTAPYALLWSTLDTTFAIEGLAGSRYYAVTVTDAHGCQATDSIYIAEFVCASLREGSFSVVTETSGDCDVKNQILIESTTEVPSVLLFSVDGGQTFQESPVFIDLLNGDYYPLIKDADLGCQLTLDPITFGDQEMMELSILDPTNCTTSDGSIINHNSNFEIALSLDGPWVSTIIDDLESGNYQIFARKPGTTCSFFAGSYKIGTVISSDAIVVLSEDAACGEELGKIEIMPTLQNITFSIDRGNTWYEDIQQFAVSPGIYGIRARTEDGCITLVNMVSIEKSESLLVKEFAKIEPSACNESNGMVQLGVEGAQVQYSIDDGKNWQSQGIFDNLPVGSFHIKYGDIEGRCQDSIQVTLTAPDITSAVDTVQILDPSCFGAQDGYIHLGIVGDTGQFIWEWTHGPTKSDIGRLAAGNFEVKISDEFCVIKKAITLSQPAEIEIKIPGLDSVLYCQGQTIDFSLVDTQYSYDWYLNEKFIAHGPDLKIGQEGSYELKAQDEAGCSVSKQFDIAYSEEVFHANFLLATRAVIGQPTSAIEISWPVPDEISWEIESGMVLETLLNRSIFVFDTPGEHIVRLKAVKDGCMSFVEKQILVVENAGLLDSLPTGVGESIELTLFPNPNLGNFNLTVELADESGIQLRIYDANAFLVFSNLLPAATFFSQNIDLAGSPPGIYTVFVQASYGWKTVSFILE